MRLLVRSRSKPISFQGFLIVIVPGFIPLAFLYHHWPFLDVAYVGKELVSLERILCGVLVEEIQRKHGWVHCYLLPSPPPPQKKKKIHAIEIMLKNGIKTHYSHTYSSFIFAIWLIMFEPSTFRRFHFWIKLCRSAALSFNFLAVPVKFPCLSPGDSFIPAIKVIGT